MITPALGAVPGRSWQRCRRPPAPRGAAGKGRGSGARREPGWRRAGPSRRGAGAVVGAAAAAQGAAVGRAAGAVRRAGAGAALLRPLPPLLDVRRHARPRRAAAGRAERLLRVQPRLHRHRRDVDGRAAGAGAALPARRREVAELGPGWGGGGAVAPCATPLVPYSFPASPE